MDKLDQIKKKIEEYQNKSAVTGDLKAFITLVLGVVKTAKENFDKTSKENIQIIQEAVNYIDKEHSKLLKNVSQETESAKNELEKKLNEAKSFLEEVKKIKAKKGDDGEDGYTPVKGVDYFTETEIKEIKDDLSKSIPLELSGEKVVDKINSLPIDEDEFKIDVSHIKNLPKTIAKGGHSPTVLANAVDLDQTARADGYAVVWDATNSRFKFASTGGGTIDGSGTTDELTYWVDSNTIGALAVATYPSKAEIAHVKGVTSAIQTQLNAKANSSGALTQFVGNTAWRVFYSDGNGDITELALGADGTFLKSNGAGVAPTFATPAGSGDVSKVGTPVNNQIGVWTGDGTLEGDADLTFDTTTNTLATGIVTVTDDAYAAGWNGSTAVPTKNAVYDKIESMGGGVTESFVIAMATAL